MRINSQVLIAAAASGLAGGCAQRDWHYRPDLSSADLYKLYESGQINAEQYFSRRRALEDWWEREARLDAIKRASEPTDLSAQSDTQDHKKDEKCKNSRQSGQPCPHPPGRH